MNSRSPVNSVNGFECINKRFCTHTRFEPVTHPEWRRLIGYYCISAVGGLGPPRHIALCQFTRCPWRETRSMKLHAALIITFNDTCCFSGAQDAVNKCPLLRCDYGYKKKHIRLRIFHFELVSSVTVALHQRLLQMDEGPKPRKTVSENSGAALWVHTRLSKVWETTSLEGKTKKIKSHALHKDYVRTLALVVLDKPENQEA
ncbi:hypothetical protein F2P81_023793 [Scophthalmus maximus]|uniref:Uncharacterized protein n=1 Tax=Scophthalmus maximus TaxID=52904 RepID=A0A6A4RMS9_SCOMX|nr:hypothetical protein F2P81_023793 [Scophthalmus maximus]